MDKTVVIEILIEEKISCHPHNHDGSAKVKREDSEVILTRDIGDGE